MNKTMITSYIGIGTNVERDKHLQAAWQELSQLGKLRASTVYQCDAVGFEGSIFYNLVIELTSSLSLSQLSIKLRQIETKWGRPEQAQKCQNRTLDLDILLFGDVSSTTPLLPRPDIFIFPFVIQPLYELCPKKIVPVDGRSIEEIWSKLEQPLTSLTKVDFNFT